MKMPSKSANKSEKNGSKGKQVNSQLVAKAEQPLLQIGDRTVTGTELAALLNQYQLLPKLQEEMVIEQAIASFNCTPEEEAECCEYFYKQRRLNTEVARQKWLQEQNMTAAQLTNLATRELRIEKFKQATWGDNLENYFMQQKSQLDQYVYSLIRVRDGDVANELYFRLKEGEQTFAEIAKQYSEGLEAKTGGLIGPVALGLSHPKLAQILKASQPGQLIPPAAIEDLWIIVRIEKIIPAQFDEAMQQKLLDELFANWLKEQLKKPAALQLAAS
ncbi:peptidylprolyl isomerase [Microseira wollei]|nr:peptidylprolyl isomerase [Microseira wollei]